MGRSDEQDPLAHRDLIHPYLLVLSSSGVGITCLQMDGKTACVTFVVERLKRNGSWPQTFGHRLGPNFALRKYSIVYP